MHLSSVGPLLHTNRINTFSFTFQEEFEALSSTLPKGAKLPLLQLADGTIVPQVRDVACETTSALTIILV